MRVSNTKYNTKNTIPIAIGMPLWFFVSFVFLFSHNLAAQKTEKVYLSGTGNDNTVNWEFFCTNGMNSNKWTTIPVPSCWELQNFGKYDYGFAKDSIRGKEKGMYKYRFNVPSSWQGKTINIVFEGVMTDAEVKINGNSAGPMHQGAFYAFKYDITKQLQYGKENLLEVTVAKHSSNESVNAAERKADFWIFGGIFRPVWLEILPARHISSVAINAKANGDFIANVMIADPYHSHDFTGYTIETKIFDAKTNKLIRKFESKASWMNEIKEFVQDARLWSPESPDLYKAVFTLSVSGKVDHVVEKKFGFRTVEVKQRDGIYVNGIKVKMKGVNRHSFWPNSGRTTSKKISIDDVLTMKDMNMNAVRMSHYPPDDHFLDACDSLGLFVMDELAGWHGHYDTPTGTKLAEEMLEHDINHPSIIFWANGNEGGHNFELDHLFKEEIQQRPVVHPWQLFGNIETQHYREYNYGIGNYENGREIIMPTEFLHGQFDGGHGAGLEDYWEKMWHDPLSAGGFLWDFADQGVVRKDLNDSIDTDKFRGADGIIGPFHQKEGSYYAIKEIWSPVVFEKKQITNVFDGKLNIENRYFYTNINQCRFSWRLAELKMPSKYDTSSVTGVVKVSPDIKPGARGVLQLNLPVDWERYDALYITAKGRDGKEIFTWSWPLIRPSENVASVWRGSKGFVPEPVISVSAEQPQLLKVKSGEHEFFFNRGDGWLLGTKMNGISFGTGPALCEGVTELDTVIYYIKNKLAIIEVKYKKKSLIHSLKWTAYPSGWLKMELDYFPSGYFSSMVGVNFSFPEDSIKGIEYMGDGPYRVWKNRMKGTQFGVWQKKYNKTETGEAPWIYPEFKGYYANMYWCKFITTGKSFTVLTENEDLFLRLYTPAWKTDQWHNYEPIFPTGDISFMQGIPGIGSKTQRNETTGPMGMKNIFYDYEKDPSRALKMVLYFNFFEKQ